MILKNYKYDEVSYAEKIYATNSFQTKYVPTELKLLSLYLRDYKNMKPKEVKEALMAFCKKNIPDFNRAKYYKTINRTMTKATDKNQKLVRVEKVDIYFDEVRYINSLDIDYQYKKLIFAFLVQMRLNKIVYEAKNGKEYTSIYFKGGKKKYQSIKSMANVSSKTNINDDFIYDVSHMEVPLIVPMYSGLVCLKFLESCIQSGEVVIEVRDFENVGWYLDYYNGINGVVLCEKCGQPFKQRRKDSRFCEKHKEYEPMGYKSVTCVDCGKEFLVNSKDNKTCRCDNCYNQYRRLYKAKKEAERRNRPNSVDSTI